jgi:hypothetical protein
MLLLPARTTAAALASTAASRTTPTTAAALARHHRTSLVDNQRAAHQIAAVAGFHGAVGGSVVVDFNEPEPASLTSKTITHYVHAIDGDARLREEIR